MQIAGGISLQELSRLLGGAAATFGHIPTQRSVENDDSDPDYVDEEEEDEDTGSYYGQYQRTAHQWFPAVTEPQEAGLHLLMSGEFGRVGQRLGQKRNNTDVARLLRDRGTKAQPFNYREDITGVSLLTSCCIFHDLLHFRHRTLCLTQMVLQSLLPQQIYTLDNSLKVWFFSLISDLQCRLVPVPRFFLLLHMQPK
jgi:hypothetical protein